MVTPLKEKKKSNVEEKIKIYTSERKNDSVLPVHVHVFLTYWYCILSYILSPHLSGI